MKNKTLVIAVVALSISTVGLGTYYYIFYVKIKKRSNKIWEIQVNNNIVPLPQSQVPIFEDVPVPESAIY